LKTKQEGIPTAQAPPRRRRIEIVAAASFGQKECPYFTVFRPVVHHRCICANYEPLKVWLGRSYAKKQPKKATRNQLKTKTLEKQITEKLKV